MEPAGQEVRRRLREQKLLERIFTASAQPAELLIEQFYRQEDVEPLLFGAVALYGRTWNSPVLETLFEAFDEVFYYIPLPKLTLLLIRAGEDCRRTAGRIYAWLRDRGAVMNVAYLPGERRLPEARQICSAFEAAAPEMFFRSGCLSLEELGPMRTETELREPDLRRLRQIRQDMNSGLIRGESESVRERLKEYFTISAQGGPALFRELCTGLYFRMGEELAAPDEKRDMYRQQLRGADKTVFLMLEEANRAEEIEEHISWYIDQLLAWYRPLRRDTSCRVAAFVEEYIGNHYMEPISIEEIAAQVGLSANYVRSIFKNRRGKTVQRYLSDYRLEMACQLLRSTPATVSRVGQLVGYNNVSYFCASFQKRYGKTPSEWRRDLCPLGGEDPVVDKYR